MTDRELPAVFAPTVVVVAVVDDASGRRKKYADEDADAVLILEANETSVDVAPPFDPSCNDAGVDADADVIDEIEGEGECGDAREFKDAESSSKSPWVSAASCMLAEDDASFVVDVAVVVEAEVASPFSWRVDRRSLKEENMADVYVRLKTRETG